ncbi:MAG: hypothetical protein MUO27_01840 [Sedimentisphaerales bacterium]|nr:hypothetical protein [Sedimentisphaerales bacterium]
MIKGIINEIVWHIKNKWWHVKNKWFFHRQKRLFTKKINPFINPLADFVRKLSDKELLQKSQDLRHRFVNSKERSNLAEACALICEALLRCRGKLPSDTQLIGSILITEGRIVEIDSGEDISMIFLLAIYIVVISGMHVHAVFKEEPPTEIVDLARSVFKLLGISVGCITSELDPYLDREYCRTAYACDVTYGSYSTFGMYYLRNNLKNTVTEQLPISQDFAVVNEADSILLDNVRRELVIAPDYHHALAKIMVRNYFKLYKKLAGVAFLSKTYRAEAFSKVYGLSVVSIPPSQPDNSLKPSNRIDYDDYIFKDKGAKYQGIVEEIYRISESGRPVVVVTNDLRDTSNISQLLLNCGIGYRTIAHYVYYVKGQTVYRPLWPLNGRRRDPMLAEIADTIGEQCQKENGQMIGNVTIFNRPLEYDFVVHLGYGIINEKCSVPSMENLKQIGIKIEDLFPPGAIKCCINCPQYDKVTNCARCFKAKLHEEFPLHGRVECYKNVPCGFHIIGTERDLCRGYDNEILDRFIQRGVPGSSRFFLSFDDDLMKTFAPEFIVKALSLIGWQEGEAIYHKKINKGIRKSQEKFERRDFERHKNSFYYDDILYNQMFIFYSERQKTLQAGDTKTLECYDRAWENHLFRTDELMTCISRGNYVAGLDPKVLYSENMDKMFQKMVAELSGFQSRAYTP